LRPTGRAKSEPESTEPRTWPRWSPARATSLDLCLGKDGLGFQVFNATNDEIIASQPTMEFLARHAPNTPVTREMSKFEAPLSNRKARELLGFTEEHSWRKYAPKG
jgi:hypothetical protein